MSYWLLSWSMFSEHCPWRPLRPCICQWTLFLPVMSHYLFGTKPLPEPMITYCQTDPWKKLQGNICSRYTFIFFNSLWHNYALWYHRPQSILVQVMACCLTAPSHHLRLYVDFLLVRFGSIRMRAISQRVPQLLFCIMSLKMILLKWLRHLPGHNKSTRSFTNTGKVQHDSKPKFVLISTEKSRKDGNDIET